MVIDLIAYYENNVNNIRVGNSFNLSFPPHLHKEIEFVLCIKGEITVTCDNQTKVMGEGDFLFALPYTVHSYLTKDYSNIILGIIPPDYLPIFKTYFSLEASYPFIDKIYTSELCEYSNQLNDEYKNSNNIGKVVGYLHLIFASVIEKMDFVPRRVQDNNYMIQKILNYLEGNFTENLTLKRVSQNAGLNQSYFSRFFSDKIGCTLTRYIHELRINYAKHLLCSIGTSVTQTAFESGFSTVRSFNRIFFELVGVTPTEYKKLYSTK